MANQTQVLLVEDSPSLAAIYEAYLQQENCQVVSVDTGNAALEAIAQTLPEVMLLDLKLPDMDGMQILEQVHQQRWPIMVIIITAHGSIDIAVEAMRFGAFDFLVKPFDAKRLRVTLRNALKQQQLTRIVDTYRDNFERDHFQNFIGTSLPMQAIYRIIESAAPSKASVFITGESGTGKELCAEAIHKLSPRRNKPFVVLNCAAIPKDLIESEIFGHVKGAFTGALSERKGAATQADGGTLFLDELCEMDLDLQSKLLRFTQTGTFQKVGSSKTEQVDVRFVCATNRDPLNEVQAGRFREDLYYRLHVVPIQIPPLRERDDDVLLIAQQFLDQFAKEENKRFNRFSGDVETVLLNYTWPGNVRELQNIIRNIIVLNNDEQVSLNMLPGQLNHEQNLAISKANKANIGPVVGTINNEGFDKNTDKHIALRPLWQIEKETIEQAIAHADGNIPKAAALLEISPSTIYRKRQSWGEPI